MLFRPTDKPVQEVETMKTLMGGTKEEMEITSDDDEPKTLRLFPNRYEYIFHEDELEYVGQFDPEYSKLSAQEQDDQWENIERRWKESVG